MKLKFGRISGRRDDGLVRVKFESDDIVSDWIPPLVAQSETNKENWPLDINTYVACIMDINCENGVCLGALNTKKDVPASGFSLTIWIREFSDGAKMSYDPDAHLMEFDTNGGDIVLNGGTNDGIPKINPLLDKINNIENLLNDLISKYNSHTHGGVATGTGSSGPTLVLEEDVLTPTIKSDIENTKVTH